MPEVLIDWVVRFSVFCAINYSTITVATALVSLVMAAVLLLVGRHVLNEEAWVRYLGLAFGSYFVQYGLRTLAAYVRGGDYSTLAPRLIETFAQSLFSNLTSLLFLLAALALLYRLPNRWWRTGWSALAGVFLLSAILGLTLSAPWDRYLDATLSAVCLSFLVWAMFVSSGTRQRHRWARLNLVGGVGYAALHVVYAWVPTLAQWPRIAEALTAELKKYGPDPMVLPSPEAALDAGIFAFAFAFKVTLFIGALLVVMRCLSAFSPSVSRAVLEPVKVGRAEFLSAHGIVRAVGESIGSDTAALYFRLPGADEDRVRSFTWSPDSQADVLGQVILQRPLSRDSAIGMTLESDEIVWSRDVKSDSRFVDAESVQLPGFRSYLNIPLVHHGAVIGCLAFDWRRPSAFTASDVQRARQVADFVTPVVQSERWLHAVGELRKRLQRYDDTETIAGGRFIRAIGDHLHDILSPIGTAVLFDFGFRPEWTLAGSEISCSEDSTDHVTLLNIEERFLRQFGLEAAFVAIPLTSFDTLIGKIIFAIGRGHDPLDRPSLTQDTAQLAIVADLVKDVLFDLHRIRLGGILDTLRDGLDAGGFASEVLWLRALQSAATEAGLLWLTPEQKGSDVAWAELPTSSPDLVDVRGTSAVDVGGYRTYKWRSPEKIPCCVVQIPLPLSGETLYVGIGRADFGTELQRQSPWKAFLDRLAEAADSTLVRIRASELETQAMRFEMNDLLVHELRSPAEEFQQGVEWMEETMLGTDIPANDSRRQIIEALRRSAHRFLELADSIRNPILFDKRFSVPLREVVQKVAHFYEERLAARSIALQVDVPSQGEILVPFHVAYIVLVSLVQNAREAIGQASGIIFIRTEDAADDILLHVDDTGSGVAEHQRDRIFQLGFSTKNRGSGLGLPLARRALNRYKGDLVHADQKPPEVATRFTIRFPRRLRDNEARLDPGGSPSSSDSAA